MNADGLRPRRPLRDEVREAILARLADGRHPVGSRIHEGRLAEDLQVSRTPVREALMALEKMGILEVKPNSGFFVAAVSDTDVRAVYPIIGALERLAVALTPPENLRSLLPALTELNARFRDTGTPSSDAGTALDEEWHRVLTSACGNARLLEMVDDLKRSVGRYEASDMADPDSRHLSADQHDHVIREILAAKPEAAGDAVMRNWALGMERVLGRASAGDSRP